VKTASVARRLTQGVIALQLVSVGIAVMAASLIYFSQRTSGDSAAIVLERIAPHIRRAEDGTLFVAAEGLAMPAFQDETFWIYIGDGTEAFSHGPLPERLKPFFSDADDLVSDIAATSDVDTPAGRVTTVAGNAPRMATDFSIFFEEVAEQFVQFILLPSVLLSALFVPWMVRRILGPITGVAEAADRLEAGQTGQRLPIEDGPVEIVPLIRAMNRALERVDSWADSQRRFIADAAHELRTPITVLQVRLDGLPAGELAEDLREDCRRLARLADRLLEIERVRAIGLRLEPVDLNHLAQNAAIQFAPRAVSLGVALAFEAAPVPVLVDADFDSLMSCLFNLLENAVRHGGPDVVMSVRALPCPVIAVSDSGAGVREDLADRLFEPFVSTPGSGGSGLGLALVSDIMKAHGGQIRHLSFANRTVFQMEFAGLSIPQG
jgi:signal transduction histidine kinase